MKITDERLIDKGYLTKSMIWPMGKNGKCYWICYNIDGTREYEHRLIYEIEFGSIPHDYIVHHKNGDGLNNNIDNLDIMSRAQHNWEHGKKIYIDGVMHTLSQTMDRFGYYDKCNTIKAIKYYIKTKSRYSRFSGHEVRYE